jgi:hypothetical protein
MEIDYETLYKLRFLADRANRHYLGGAAKKAWGYYEQMAVIMNESQTNDPDDL